MTPPKPPLSDEELFELLAKWQAEGLGITCQTAYAQMLFEAIHKAHGKAMAALIVDEDFG
ncbi:hypothetical protein [Sagittula sp. S175]|uniref:hypothetical protein n=1 Tax=Sagittula sp. S175 TaxID=3415129 RepID=UPI003C7B5CE2